MSLDRSNPTAVAYTKPQSALAGLTVNDFGGEPNTADNYIVQVDTTAAAVDGNTMPVSMLDANGNELFTKGVRAVLVKISDDKNGIFMTDPLTGLLVDHVDRQKESLTMIFDGANGRWIFDW